MSPAALTVGKTSAPWRSAGCSRRTVAVSRSAAGSQEDGVWVALGFRSEPHRKPDLRATHSSRLAVPRRVQGGLPPLVVSPGLSRDPGRQQSNRRCQSRRWTKGQLVNTSAVMSLKYLT
ncbi:hypothetical protein EYF80_046725 [Liparis tanakae]|uniref:Uncharacterized protein n=1 Tax=Liparis tanakae TaxID=230148 RepID=A0A4Z2FQ18_9TELE|nr:hypothetical protein EYF80_046725 [Liparis tanakae]